MKERNRRSKENVFYTKCDTLSVCLWVQSCDMFNINDISMHCEQKVWFQMQIDSIKLYWMVPLASWKTYTNKTYYVINDFQSWLNLYQCICISASFGFLRTNHISHSEHTLRVSLIWNRNQCNTLTQKKCATKWMTCALKLCNFLKKRVRRKNIWCMFVFRVVEQLRDRISNNMKLSSAGLKAFLSSSLALFFSSLSLSLFARLFLKKHSQSAPHVLKSFVKFC